MGKPRVIFVNRVYRPSAVATAQLLTDLAEGLAARDWSVQVIAAGEESGLLNGVTVHRAGPGEQHGGLISRARNYWRFIQLAREKLALLIEPGDRVVIMSDPPMLGTALAETVFGKNARLIHWIQDIYPEVASAHIGAWSEVPLAPLTLKRNAAWFAADRCVVLGADMARTLTGQKVPAGRISVVPNWAPRELQQTAPSIAVTAQRAAWGLADKFIVAYSGNLGRVHEFKTVLTAAGMLRNHAAIVFLFIGQGARLANAQATAQKENLANIRFLPPAPREDLAVSLASADIQLVTLQPAFTGLVYPSKLAGVLAAGRPVVFVGPPDGEIARFLHEENCGETVAPGDAARLVEVLGHGQAQSVRQEPQQAARAAYEKHFTFATALAQWEKILIQAGAKG